ncbi:MAG: hypothetical protein WAU56_18240 [Steroidobacteraceae bacterium]
MSRKENKLPTENVRISTNPVVKGYLERLVLTGLYGKTAAEVAERLVAQEIRRLIAADELPKTSD